MKFSALLISLFFFNASALTLTEALEKTYEYNPQLKSQREAVKKADEQVMQALGNFLPTVQVSQQKNFYITNPNAATTSNPNLNGTSDSITGPSITVSQNLFNGFSDISNMAVAKNSIQSARVQLIAVEQEVLFNAIKSYLDVVNAEGTLKISQYKLASYRTFVEATKERFRVGDTTRTDVAQAEAQYSQAVSDKIRAEGAVIATKANFLSVVGIDPDNLSMPDIKVELPPSIEDAVKIAQQNNPNNSIARYNLAAADASVSAARGALLPDASLQFQRTKANTSLTTGGTSNVYSNTTIVQVIVPVFTGGKDWSSLRATKRDAASKKYSLKNTQNDTYDNTVKAWESFETAKASMSARKDALEYSKIAWDGMQAEEKAGTRTTVDVIIAQNNFFDNDIRLLEEKVNYYKFYYALKAQLGALTAKSLGLKVEYYDPLENYNKISKELIGAF
jgi:outer membrane protein